MRLFGTGLKALLLSSALLLSTPILVPQADAAQVNQHHHTLARPTVTLHAHRVGRLTASELRSGGYRVGAHGLRVSHLHYTSARSYGISCVPYARAASGILVAGNAWEWWYNSQGLYARGDRPEAGSVLNFRANGRMHLGHVAVVTQVLNSREVVIEHANWPSGAGGVGGVTRGVAVVDVSEANNWSAVRVELGRRGEFGSVYPTYGFIYNRPDTGVMTASISRPAPQPAINPVPSDLRPKAERPWHMVEEVAEAPVSPRHRINMQFTPANLNFRQ